MFEVIKQFRVSEKKTLCNMKCASQIFRYYVTNVNLEVVVLYGNLCTSWSEEEDDWIY